MPRALSRELREAHERLTPATEWVVEVAAPDAQRVLRRADDEWLTTPPHVGAVDTAKLAASPQGALSLKATIATLANREVENGAVDARIDDPNLRVRALGWRVDGAFDAAVLRSFSARIDRSAAPYAIETRMALRIVRASGVVSGWERRGGVLKRKVDWTLVDLIPGTHAMSRRVAGSDWVSNKAWVEWDLTQYALTLDNSTGPGSADAADAAGTAIERNVYYFNVLAADVPETANDWVRWVWSTGTHTVAGVGEFRGRTWERATATGRWAESMEGYTPCFRLKADSYNPAGGSAQAVYALDVGKAPAAASTGRVVFERATPGTSSVTMELSTAGSGGPWTVVTHESAVAVKQQTYHVRLTLAPSTSLRLTPLVFAAGVEFRTPYAVTRDCVLEHPPSEVAVPFLEAGIGEGSLRLLRTGRRDYEDAASLLGSSYAPTALEVDVFLGADPGRVPWCDRSKWLRVQRATVSDRGPGVTSEAFTLLSYAQRCKRKIPAQAETIPGSIHTVQSGSLAAAVFVSPDLPLTAGAPTAYNGRGYYMRVRSSAVAGLGPNYVQTITGSATGTSVGAANQLLFTSPNLPAAPAAGDVVEIHSGVFTQPALSWVDAEPADIWDEVLELVGVPPERVGRAELGKGSRAGRPPRASDVAPGDATTQAKLLVTMRLNEAEEAWKLLQELSFIRGGTTVEVAGQIVYRQIYPLYDAAGNMTVMPDGLREPRHVFTPGTTVGLDTPTGLAERAPTVVCAYGVNYTAADPDATPGRTTAAVDADALAWHQRADVESLAPAEVPEDVARWLYNTADQGLYLASQLARMVGSALSTGLRVWPWGSTDAHPDLVVGDTVAVVTDQYTDYDPATRTPITGWNSYPLVLVAVEGGGRRFRGFMLGLSGVTRLQSGTGTLGGPLVPRPEVAITATPLSTTPARVDGTASVTNDLPSFIKVYAKNSSAATAGPSDVPIASSDTPVTSLPFSDAGGTGGTARHYYVVATASATGSVSLDTASARTSVTFPAAGSSPHIDSVVLSGSVLDEPPPTSASGTATVDYGSAPAGSYLHWWTRPAGDTTYYWRGSVAAVTGATPADAVITVSGFVGSTVGYLESLVELLASSTPGSQPSGSPLASGTSSDWSGYRSHL